MEKQEELVLEEDFEKRKQELYFNYLAEYTLICIQENPKQNINSCLDEALLGFPVNPRDISTAQKIEIISKVLKLLKEKSE